MRGLEDLVPAEHPLRAVRTTIVNEALVKVDGLFSDM